MVDCDPVDAMLGLVEPVMPEQRRRQVETDVRAALDEILRNLRPGQPVSPLSNRRPRRTRPKRPRQQDAT